MNPRRILEELYGSALAAVDPRRLVAGFLESGSLDLSHAGRIGVFAAGKASVAMSRGVPARIARKTLIVAPRPTADPSRAPATVLLASHPEPDVSSKAAAKAAIKFFRGFGKGDLILALISGGASSLLCFPRRGVSLREKKRRVRAAMQAGWSISRLNALRTSLSRIKGGRLAEMTAARVVTLIISDVPGSDYRIVGSGPTVSKRKAKDRAILLADNRTGLCAAAGRASELGFEVRIQRRIVAGDAQTAGRSFAAALLRLGRRWAGRPVVFLAGGETTVRLAPRHGRGGRNQEFALSAAIELSGSSRLFVLAAGSDGIDGNSSNAGAFVDGSTVELAIKRGFIVKDYLRRHDSARLVEELACHFRPGSTGSNVADWCLGIARPV